MKRLNNKGFSMIELLVVLLIIGILAAVAAPMFLGNSAKAKASEAVAGAGSIRSALRVWAMNGNAYTSIVDGVIYTGSGYTALGTALGVTFTGQKYFSPECFSIYKQASKAAFPSGSGMTPTATTDFVIIVDGSSANSVSASGSTGYARNGSDTDVNKLRVWMDNSGGIVYSTDGGTNYSAW